MLRRLPRTKRTRERELRRLRMVRYRENRAAGIAVAPTPYTTEVVDYLVRLRWLSQDAAGDPRAVRAAIGRALPARLKHHRHPCITAPMRGKR